MRQEKAKDRKKKDVYRVITLRDDQGVIFCGPTPELPIRDAAVLKMSTEIFGDPEPCMIHRSAVLARIFEEFEHWLDCTGAARECEVLLHDLPGHMASRLDIGGNDEKS